MWPLSWLFSVAFRLGIGCCSFLHTWLALRASHSVKFQGHEEALTNYHCAITFRFRRFHVLRPMAHVCVRRGLAMEEG